MDNQELKCKICSKQFDILSDFTSHLRSDHKLTIKAYCLKELNKRDFYSNEELPFKNYENYISVDFINRRNYKLWLKSVSTEDATQYLINKITSYCLAKEISIMPCEVELSTIKSLLTIGEIEYFTKVPISEICNIAKLKSRFNYSVEFKQLKLNKINNITIDTREQKPFSFKDIAIENLKLEYGDYASNVYPQLSIERKSLNDFLSTLSGGFERFEREIQRSKDLNGYIVVVCESTLNDILYQKRRFGKCSPEFILHKMRKLMRENDNLQFVFCDGKADARDRALFILSIGEQAKSIDLQYYFNKYGTNNW